MNVTERVRAVAARALADGGVDVVDVEVRGAGRQTVVTLTIDKPGGVTVDDCAEVSTVVSRSLDADDPIAGPYRLDVQSPGLERTLRTADDFARAVGRAVSVKRHGHQPLLGTLVASHGSSVVVETDAGPVEVALESVVRARTVLDWGKQNDMKREASR